MRDEGGFPLVTIFDANIVVPPADVKLSKQFGVFEFVDEVGDEGEWIGVVGGMFVQVSVVLTGAETAVLFFLQKRMGMPGGNLKDGSFRSQGFPGGSLRWLFVLWRIGGRLFQLSG